MFDPNSGCIDTFTQVYSTTWWTAEFAQSYNVTSVQLLMDKLFGGSAQNLVVKIGDKVCSSISGMPSNGAWVTLECNSFGIVGRNIRLENNIPIMVICGIKVEGFPLDIDEDNLPTELAYQQDLIE